MRSSRRVVTAVAVWLGGCSSGRPVHELPAPAKSIHPAGADPTHELEALAEEHIAASLAASPTLATWLGQHDRDDRLDDLGGEAQAREQARLRNVVERARAIPARTLDAVQRFDRALLLRDAELGLAIAAEHRGPLRTMDLLSSSLEQLLARDFAPLPNRIRSIVARLHKTRGLVDDARRNLRNPPELATRRAVELAQSNRTFIAETLPKVVSALGDEAVNADFKLAQADALRALDELTQWMQRELALRSKGELAIGAERLAARLRLGEGVSTSLAELLAAGHRELANERTRYDELLKAAGKAASEAVRLLEDDHPSAEELVPAAGAALDQAAKWIRSRRLLTLPDRVPRLAEMPPFLWGFLTLSTVAPLESRDREADYYVDPVDRNWTRKRREEHLRTLNRSQLLLSALHQGFPGHFVQSTAARRAPTAIERWVQDGAFIEGWAAYAEAMMLDDGFAAGDVKLRLAALRESLLRTCRFIVAIQLHAYGGKLEEAAKLFVDEAGLDDYGARREAERAALDPMVLLPELGRLEILALRDQLRAARGDGFSLSEFHDQLLAHGAPPIPLLGQLLLSNVPLPSASPATSATN